MSKNNLLTILICCVLTNMLCKSDRRSMYFTDNKKSIFSIAPTNLCYQDYAIFKVKVPNNYPRGFMNNGYFAMKDDSFYYVGIDRRCQEQYSKGDYVIGNQRDNAAGVPNFCDIAFDYFFSTDLAVNDTFESTIDEWIILKHKFYDTILQDTVYIYEKKVSLNQYAGFSFSKSNGFLGFFSMEYDQNNEITAIENVLGEVYAEILKELYPKIKIIQKPLPVKLEFEDIDLSPIKEFKKYR